jgi:polyketide biosynthesis acyl carrier protein
MADLGLDSVSRQEVLIMTMEEIGLNLPMVQLFGPRNIGELTDLLHAKLHA